MKISELNNNKITNIWNMIYNISISMLHNVTDANRFIFILGTIFNFKSKLAAEICCSKDELYRIEKTTILSIPWKQRQFQILINLIQ